jgi:hypothetical protein
MPRETSRRPVANEPIPADLDVWFEVYIDEGEEGGTYTLQSFDVFEEAKAYYNQELMNRKLSGYLGSVLHLDIWKGGRGYADDLVRIA